MGLGALQRLHVPNARSKVMEERRPSGGGTSRECLFDSTFQKLIRGSARFRDSSWRCRIGAGKGKKVEKGEYATVTWERQ